MKRDRKRRHLALRDADKFGPPCDDILAAMAEHSNFERIDDIVDQDMDLCFCFRGEEDSEVGHGDGLNHSVVVLSLTRF